MAEYEHPPMSPKQIAQALGVSVGTARRLAKGGSFGRPVCIGLRLRWKYQNVIRYRDREKK